jgi:hypothetical protein
MGTLDRRMDGSKAGRGNEPRVEGGEGEVAVRRAHVHMFPRMQSLMLASERSRSSP